MIAKASPMAAIFTAQMLIDAEACREQVDLFRKTFGASVNVTVARARKVADKFNWGFAVRFLDDEGEAEYERVSGAAWASAYIATVARRKAAQVAA